MDLLESPWPFWKNDSSNSGRTIFKSPKFINSTKWVNSGGYSYPPILLKNGNLIVCMGGNLFCINKDTGEIIWQNEYGGSYSPLLLENDTVIISNGTPPFLAAIETDSGNLIWKSFYILEGDPFYDYKHLFLTYDGVYFGQENLIVSMIISSFTALVYLHDFNGNRINFENFTNISTNLCVYNEKIIVGWGQKPYLYGWIPGHLIALDFNLDILWDTEIYDYISGMCIDLNGDICVTANYNWEYDSLYKFSSDSGTQLWQIILEDYTDHNQLINSIPSIDNNNNIILITSNGERLISISESGNYKWHIHLYELYINLDYGLRSVLIDSKNNIICTGQSTVFSFSESGELNWSYNTDMDIIPSRWTRGQGIPVIDTSAKYVYLNTADGIICVYGCSTNINDKVNLDVNSGTITHSANTTIGDRVTINTKTGLITRSCPGTGIGDKVYLNKTGFLWKSR